MDKSLADALAKRMGELTNVAEGPNVFTTLSYMKETGLSRSGAKLRLYRLEQAGAIRRVKVRITDGGGRNTITDGWEYVERNAKQ